MKNLLFTICTLLIIHTTTMCAQNQYPIIKKNGKEYYEYTINQGEGLFAIARKFAIKQNDLHQANPNLTTNIKAGDKILIPITNDTPDTTQQTNHIHTVEAKQTLYSISKMYSVSIDTLLALNPSAIQGIKIGQKLIIKKQNTTPNITTTTQQIQAPTPQHNTTNNITHTVKPKETLYSISKQYNIAIHQLIEQNPTLKDGLKAGTTIIIQKETPTTNNIQNTDNTNKSDNTQKSDKTNTPNKFDKTNIFNKSENKSSTLNIAYLLPLIAENTNEEKNTQRFIEFYRGAILALNDAKKEGLSANIYTYNLPKDTLKIDSILQQLNDKQIDILIGPAYSEQLNKVLTYTKQHNITTIVPFSSKIDTTLYHPKLIQFNPQQDSLFTTVLKNTFEHRNLQYILARFPNCQNKGNQFINQLSKLLTENNKQHTNITITPKHIDSLVSKITPDTTILILGSTRINDITPILDSLTNYQLPNLQVWGFEEWGTNTLKKYPQTIYYSLFYPNETEEYINNYKKYFGTRQQTVGVKYDLLGYDLTTLALKGINTTNTTTLTIKPQTPNINYLQSTPHLQYIDNRWLNTNYYLLFWDNISIKVINN